MAFGRKLFALGVLGVLVIGLIVAASIYLPAQRDLAFQRWLWDVDDQIEAATASHGAPWVWTDVGFTPRANDRDYRSFADGGRIELTRFADGTTPEQVQAAVQATIGVLERVEARGRWSIKVVPPDGESFEIVWPDE